MAAGRIVLPPYFPARDRTGRLVSGAKLYVYENGTTTKATIYSDVGLSSAQANPVTANSSGQFPSIYAEAGSAETPVLYTLAVTGNAGENIGNPSVLDNWQPSLDGDTASSALAEAAAESAAADADAAAAALADMLAVQAMGDDAAAIAARAAKSANGGDFADREAVTSNLLFRFYSSDAVSRSLKDKLADNAVSVMDFGAVGDGLTDDSTAFQAAINASNGRPVYVPAYRYDGDAAISLMFLITETVHCNPVPATDLDPQPAYYPGAFAPGVRIFGDGMAHTTILAQVPNGPAFEINVTDPDPYAYRASQGVTITNLSILGSNAVPASTAIRGFNMYQSEISHLHIRNMSGSGIRLINGVEGTVPDSGWNMVTLQGLWIEGCANDGDGWAVDLTGEEGRNEGSFTLMHHVFMQSNGKNQSFRITGISTANPAVVTVSMTQHPVSSPTATAHPYAANDEIKLFGLDGNFAALNDVIYKVGPSPTASTFTLYTRAGAPVDGSAFGAFSDPTPNAEVSFFDPKSGGLRMKNQLTKLFQCGFTLNHNAAHYVKGGGGGNIGLLCEQVTWENNYRRHIYLRGGINYYFINCQFHGNAAAASNLFQWRLADMDATDNVIDQVLWQNTKVRAKECPSIAFKYSGAQGSPNNVRIRGTIWADYDYAGQSRYVGIPFDHVENALSLHYTNGTLLTLRPDQVYGHGNKTPYRKRGPNNDSGTGVVSTTGEFVAWQMSSNNGLSCWNTLTGKAGGGALANNTVYQIYMYDDDGTPALIPSTTAPTIDLDHGYMVMTGDVTMVWKGRGLTDGSAAWVASGAEFLNPLLISGGQPGLKAAMWYDSAGRKLRLKTSSGLPAAINASNADWPIRLTATTTYDPPSLAAGAAASPQTFTFTGIAAGDEIRDIRHATAGILFKDAYISAANTVICTPYNATASTLDAASGLVTCWWSPA